jgi:hypothetical protein
MKKIIKLSLLTLLSLFLVQVTFAQDEGTSGPTFAPVDIFACNFNEGKTQADLDKAVAGWNKWMDKSGAAPYQAWTYTAYYNSPAYSFDIAWLGAWPDGNAMGAGTDQWLADGDAQANSLNEVLKCEAHSNFASTQIKGGASENSKHAVLGFSDCSMKEGASFSDMMSGVAAFSNYMSEQGSVASQWIFFPVYGAEVDYDFKMVEAYPNYTELGADYERYGNGGGYIKSAEMLNDLFECGTSRIYNSTKIRGEITK